MPTAQKITLEVFDSKDYQKQLTENEKEVKAIISHYIHHLNDKENNSFEEIALHLLDKYLELTEKEQSNNNRKYTIKELTEEVDNVPFPTPKVPTFRFIDLFAGIGGFRLAMQNVGGECVYTSEWNAAAQTTYHKNFGQYPFGDITDPKNKSYIPETFDVLCAGFPCQAFSIAGHQKGFSDTRGTLFFDIEQIVEKHRPKVVFLENVKNLVSHDKGNTFKVILEILEEKLKYKVFSKVLNTATHANVPQNRERIFIVAFDPKQVPNYGDFQFPDEIPLTKTIHDVIEKGNQDEVYYYSPDHMYYPELEKTMTSKDTVYQWRRVYVRENKSNLCPTLTANMGAGGHNVPLIKDDYGIRKLTPKECFAFQGYPMDTYILPQLANSKLYMQAGNSVTMPLIERISKEIIKVL